VQKTAAPIEMPFGMLSRVDRRNHVLDGGTHPTLEGVILTGEGHAPTCLTTFWRKLYKNGWTDPDAVWVMDSGGAKEACIRWDQDSPCEGAIIRGKDMHGHARRHSAGRCAKMAEPIDLRFELWTRVGKRKHKLNRIR